MWGQEFIRCAACGAINLLGFCFRHTSSLQKCELLLSTGCHIQTTSQTSGRDELVPDTTPELLFLQSCLRKMTRTGHEPDFIATLRTQRDALVRFLFPFIAIPGDELSKSIWRPSALREQSPFRDCGGHSRWRQQLDGYRGTRAVPRRVEFLA